MHSGEVAEMVRTWAEYKQVRERTEKLWFQGIWWTSVTESLGQFLKMEFSDHMQQSYLEVKVLVTQLCLTFCDPMDRSLPGSFVLGILQASMILKKNVALIYSTQSKSLGQVSRMSGSL